MQVVFCYTSSEILRVNRKPAPEKILQVISNWATQRNGQRIKGQMPDILIRIDNTLLEGKMRANVDRLLGADESVRLEQIEQQKDINENGQLDPSRNLGRRIRVHGYSDC
ncbi:hypothetical protein RF11_00614 [Thelohanellus kitauei]|uniref:Uncharacterized protein n=1 Tax=Thelohanellus kitauei TaxID=669202 RepID=A0A0C2MGP6_THEKT|nr:hypothetical protein RF11_00614 [Thelohanellus kitauei]